MIKTNQHTILDETQGKFFYVPYLTRLWVHGHTHKYQPTNAVISLHVNGTSDFENDSYQTCHLFCVTGTRVPGPTLNPITL